MHQSNRKALMTELNVDGLMYPIFYVSDVSFSCMLHFILPRF